MGSSDKATAATGLAKVLMPVPDPHPDVFNREWPLRVGDIDRVGRLRLDAACRHIQDIGQDQLREMGHEETHPLWIVRRTMVDLIRPIEFQDMLRLRRWCSGTSNRWCEMRVRIDGRKGGLIESEAFWININRETQGPARISDDFMEALQRTTDVNRLRWKSYLTAGSREDAVEIRDFPIHGPQRCELAALRIDVVHAADEAGPAVGAAARGNYLPHLARHERTEAGHRHHHERMPGPARGVDDAL